MSSRALATFIAAVIVTAAGLVLGPAAQGSSPSPGTVQVTGTQLKSALLPNAVFLSRGVVEEQDSGRTLGHSAYDNVTTTSCPLFSVLLGDSFVFDVPGFGFGATAHAANELIDSSEVRSYEQAVYQFASSRTAGLLFAQAYAKFARCRSFTFSGERITLESESKLLIDGHQAFQVTQTISILPGQAAPTPPAQHGNALLTLDGADVFIMNSASPATPTARPALAIRTLLLIARVQALR